MKKKVARRGKKDAPLERREIDFDVARDLRRSFDALRNKLAAIGELDAEDVLDRVEAAIFHGDSRLDGQKLTHRETLAKMAGLASDAPKTRGGPKTRESRIYPRLVQIVAAERRDGTTDETIAIMLTWAWVRTYGSPDEKARAFIADLKAADLTDDDAGTFVRNVHRALEYPRTDALTNATSKQRSREHAKKLARRRRAA